MSLQIIKTPGLVALSKNIAAFQVSSSDGLDVVGVLEVETFYGSNIFDPVVQLKSKPDNNICTFYLQDILENDVLQYVSPDSDTVWHDDSVCKQMRMTFYEVRTDLEVFFQGSPAIAGILVYPALTPGQNYWFVIKPSSSGSILLSGPSSKTIPLFYSPSSEESWYSVFAEAAYVSLLNVTQELIIYEGKVPGRVVSEVFPGLIAGRSFENIRV